ncbi:hypothetical protein Cfor_02403 [Coptotermes formosanus]|uniref:Protein takeout n=1 Tax=Coptotermes formosanus TaxID=36987 RepID=A0A6L2Q6P7_COPFO|nr:hypothetical protein Cfor_02403 [Coptotermes formosanus]
MKVGDSFFPITLLLVVTIGNCDVTRLRNDQIAAKLINAAKKTLGSQIEKLPPSLSSTKELRQRFKERVVHHLMKKTRQGKESKSEKAREVGRASSDLCSKERRWPTGSFLRCRRDDPDLNSCLQAAIQKAILLMKHGVPELQMLPVDPLEVTNINIQDGVGRPVKMNLDLVNAKLHGVTQCHIKSVRADLGKRSIGFDANVPFTTIDADYIMDGKFLVLPLKGKGKCSMNLTDYDIFVKMRAEPLVKDETVYWDIKEFYLHIDTLKLFQVNFENLFNGDKELGDNTNKVLNENWKEFFEELRPILRDTFGGVFLQYTNQLFHKVPESGLFLES